MPESFCIHYVGLKGVPVTYGGVERVVEEVGARLAQRGHKVVVHCRNHYTPKEVHEYRGMTLSREPSIRTRRLDTISHAFLGMWTAARKRPDLIGLHNYPNSFLAGIGRLTRVPVVLHLHGFEWELQRWSLFDKAILRLMLRPALAAATAVISVSRGQAEFLKCRTNRPVLHVPNGVSVPSWVAERGASEEILRRLDLQKDGYILYVGRITPQKGVAHLIRAYREGGFDLPLVIVGDAEHDPEFGRRLLAEAGTDPRIRFLGYRFGDELWELYAGCRLFVFPSEVEGMPIVLLEAMGAGCTVLASRLPAVEEAGGPTLAYFKAGDPHDLQVEMERLLRDSNRARELAFSARARALARYDWDSITDAYESFYLSVLSKTGS